MIFRYHELRDYVCEDFMRFCSMGFSAEQILPAVLDDYMHGEDFSTAENVCIHLFVALNCVEEGMELHGIAEKLAPILTEDSINMTRLLLGEDGTAFLKDLERFRSMTAKV